MTDANGGKMATKDAETHFAQTWDLDSLLPHPETPAFEQTLTKFRTELASLGRRLGPPAGRCCHSNSTSAAWGEFVMRYEKIAAAASDLSSFISCHAAADADQQAVSAARRRPFVVRAE